MSRRRASFTLLFGTAAGPGAWTARAGQNQALAHAIETAGSLNAQKMAAALDNTSSLPTLVPGLSLDFTATPSVHNGYPLSYFTECTMQNGPYDLRYAASRSEDRLRFRK